MPLSKFLGISIPENKEYLLTIDSKPELENHIGTFHASVLYALAEISSGYFLMLEFPVESQQTISLVRSSKTKYLVIPKGKQLFSRAYLNHSNRNEPLQKLQKSGRAIISVKIDILDEFKNVVFVGFYEWIIRNMPSLKNSKEEIQMGELN